MARNVCRNILTAMLILMAADILAENVERTKEGYVHASTRGAGLMPWQTPGVSPEEEAFRRSIEDRKSELLARCAPVHHPVLLDSAALERARDAMAHTEWAKKHFAADKEMADYLSSQPGGFVDAMLPELTPTNNYGFTCPNCVGVKSQEGTGGSLFDWDYRNPDVIVCRECGQTYPDAKYPETAELACPRMGQTFTFYLNDEERAHADDRSGQHAWQWVGYVNHVSFSGAIRERKILFMLGGLRSLAYSYALTGEPRYAQTGARILVRLASCYRKWLYHDYWGAIADCDPMYAAWHDRSLPIEWKRHLAESVFKNDTLDKASMLRDFWGAGRIHPSTDAIDNTPVLCLAYDLFYDARDAGGQPVWTPEERATVERDLLIERIMGAEPYLGGPGKADCVNNKSPRIYLAVAAVGRCLGLTEFVDTALRGYEGLRDKSFLYDGFSKESPAYTNMYLSALIETTETLHGFTWPSGFANRSGSIDLYGTDSRLRLMLRSVIDQLRPSGAYLPLSDTNVTSGPSAGILEVGLKRYPEYFSGRHPRLGPDVMPTEYAVFNLAPSDFRVEPDYAPPELVYPAWMTAIFRHGAGNDATVLAMPFNPPGGHRHGDNLALFYADSGQTILGDQGYVGDMPVNGWIHSTVSHNLVVVDDAEQLHRGKTPRVPRLHLAATSPYVSVIEASSNAYPQCAEYRRLVALVKGPGARTLAIDVFRVKGGGKHAYRISSDVASSETPEGALTFAGFEMPQEPPLPNVGNSIARDDIFGLRDVRAVEAPPAMWQATWSQPNRQYRLWMLTHVNAVEASNGPAQTTRKNAGRRVRYLDAVRAGDNVESTFVAVHEPGGADGVLPIRAVTRLDVPQQAGPDAVALRIESEWGTYYFFNDFANEAEIDGIRFHGAFGLLRQGEDASAWLFALGATTFTHDAFGFANQPAVWTSPVQNSTESAITAETPCPEGWPSQHEGFSNYAIAHDGAYWTGFPIERIEGNTIAIRRFDAPKLTECSLYALHFVEELKR